MYNNMQMNKVQGAAANNLEGATFNINQINPSDQIQV
jgi:hypothetical protein